MSHLVELGQAISDLAVGAAAKGEVIDVEATAIRLSADHPRSGMTIDQIVAKIEHAATIAGAGLFLTNQRKAG